MCPATILWAQLRERGQEKEKKMPQPFVAMLVDNRVELWMFLVSWVLFTGRMVNTKRCEKLLQWENFDAGAITCAVPPTDLLRLHHSLRCMGSGSAADRR